MLNLVEPGLTLNRGRVMRGLHLPTLKLAKLRLQEKEIDKDDFLGEVKKSMLRIKEAVSCFEEIAQVCN